MILVLGYLLWCVWDWSIGRRSKALRTKVVRLQSTWYQGIYYCSVYCDLNTKTIVCNEETPQQKIRRYDRVSKERRFILILVMRIFFLVSFICLFSQAISLPLSTNFSLSFDFYGGWNQRMACGWVRSYSYIYNTSGWTDDLFDILLLAVRLHDMSITDFKYIVVNCVW